MNGTLPNSPFATRFSGREGETHLRITNIAKGQHRRPAFVILALALLVILSCGWFFSFGAKARGLTVVMETQYYDSQGNCIEIPAVAPAAGGEAPGAAALNQALDDLRSQYRLVLGGTLSGPAGLENCCLFYLTQTDRYYNFLFYRDEFRTDLSCGHITALVYDRRKDALVTLADALTLAGQTEDGLCRALAEQYDPQLKQENPAADLCIQNQQVEGFRMGLLHGDRVDEVALDGDVVTRHSHLGALGELDRTGNVGGTEVELRTITIEERGVTAALLLGQNVDLAGELGVRGNRTGLAENLAALDVLALDAAEQQTDVVASLAEVHGLTEHLDTGNDGVLGILDADDLDGLVELELTALDTAGSNGTTAGDGHNVLNGHQEGEVVVTSRRRDVLVDSLHELADGVHPLGVALESAQSGTTDDGDVVAGEIVLGEELTGLHLDEVDELVIVDHVALVQEDDDVGNADLTGEQDVLAGLSHGAVGSGDDQDSAVHLSSTGNHVLDVVSVARAVNVSVVTGSSLVLDVGDGDRNAALALLRSLVDVLERSEVSLAALGLGENLGDGGGQRGLAVVDVTNGADVNMRLSALKLLFGHKALL